MEKLIQEKLQEVEQTYGVEILLACETGSRAWGFPSPDSDYDVRFIYRHPQDWYLSIDEQKDTLEYLQGDLDLVGWDIRKSLKLLRKSNAAMFERLQSPIIYRQRTNFREQLLRLAPEYFSCRAGLHHYLSMAFNYYQAVAPASVVKLKSYFYLLRTTLASRWIVEQKSMPPLAFRDLLPLVQETKVLAKIEELLGLKATVNETYLHPKETDLETYILEKLRYCESHANIFEKQLSETEKLNNLFRNII
ncbi:MAG: DNA polymerase beta superfamily protein [Adhaeribacter sp.]